MLENQWRVYEAHQSVSKKRPMIRPNYGFMQQLAIQGVARARDLFSRQSRPGARARHERHWRTGRRHGAAAYTASGALGACCRLLDRKGRRPRHRDAQLTKVGLDTGERVWRMPLGPEYDKQIDSQFADMKNTGTRNGGSITAAQFLQRFVDDTPWAHLDIAGTAMGAPKSDINQSWGSGFGVRLLERLIADYYEAK